ncbi:MAG: Uma2 family endonuclease [Chloroflexi bacterium]|nr:Uma2 family endonuclease [Chloroflexota bacterium]
MTIVLSEKLLTIPEFLAMEWPDDEFDTDYELIGGRVVARQGITSKSHSLIVGRISTALNIFAGDFAGEKQTGLVFPGGSTNLGNPQGKHFPKPDCCFVLKERLPADSPEIAVAPDIVIEVNSPSDTDERRVEKLQMYQQAGVVLIWSIHMLEKYVMVYQLGKTYPTLLTLENELDGGEVLPGFKLKVSKLFE